MIDNEHPAVELLRRIRKQCDRANVVVDAGGHPERLFRAASEYRSIAFQVSTFLELLDAAREKGDVT